MTKTALGAYTRALSGELNNICEVYSINPSFVNTEMAERVSSNYKVDKNNLNNNSIIINDSNKLIDPYEIANIINLILNKKTRYVSGDEIIVLSDMKTSYMKYLYNNITNNSNIKINLDDVNYL